jgi:acyl-CoA thioesterase
MKTIKGYYNLYRNSGASTIDFTTYLVKECHSKKVETLVNEWVLSNQSSQRIMDSMTIEDILK